jgi:hypothetical protein
MTWLIIEGLDRTGKSTIAELYRAKNFDILHFSAPDKKFTDPKYTGPDYLSTLIELLVSLSGKDVVFDRSWYGELVWPQIYGRRPLLTKDDIDILREIEDQNDPTRIIMHDPDIRAHWQRCIDNNEPLDPSQFNSARELFGEIAKEYAFEFRTRFDIPDTQEIGREGDMDTKNYNSGLRSSSNDELIIPTNIEQDADNSLRSKNTIDLYGMTNEQKKLAEANAINHILSKPIIKAKGDFYDSIELKLRCFLNNELANLLGTNQSQSQGLTSEEVQFLKILINRGKK